MHVWYIPVVAVLGAVTSILALIAIFLYKDRQRQRKVILTVQMLTIGFTIVLYGGLLLAGDFETYRAGAIGSASLLALFLPVIAYISFYLARRGVQRDIDLVKSMDRLR